MGSNPSFSSSGNSDGLSNEEDGFCPLPFIESVTGDCKNKKPLTAFPKIEPKLEKSSPPELLSQNWWQQKNKKNSLDTKMYNHVDTLTKMFNNHPAS